MEEEIGRLRNMGELLQGPALNSYIQDVTSNKKIFHFGEFLSMQNIRQLEKSSPQNYGLLVLFAYQDYSHYVKNRQQYPQLTAAQLRKIKQLSIISRCENSKEINTRMLVKELAVGELELIDMLTEMCQLGIIKLKINEKTNLIRIQYCISRDIRLEQADRIWQRLNQVLQHNEDILSHIDRQIAVAKK